MSGARLRWREDAFRIATTDGVFVLTHQGTVSLKGAAVRHWLDRLAPHLDGRYSLAELTASLDPARREYVERLLATLLDRGVVREVRPDRPHRLMPEEIAEHGGEIGFIGYFRNSAAGAFERYRNGVVLVVGSGVLASAVVRAARHSGTRTVRAVVTEIDLGGLVAAADLVVHAGDRPAPGRAARIDRLCARHEVPVAHVMAGAGEVWASPTGTPGADAPAWSEGWRRLAALAPAGPDASVTDGTAAQVVANQVVHGAFRHRTGLLAHTAPVLTRTDADTLRTTEHRFLPHPYGDDVELEDADGFRRRIEVLTRAPRLDPEKFSQRAAGLTDPRLGVFGEITEADAAQSPLRVSHTLVSDPVGLLGTAVTRPRAVGAGVDFPEARHRAALRALAVYGSLVLDPRRVSTSDGSPLFGPDDDPGQALRRLRDGRLQGCVRAIDLTDGQAPLIPVSTAYPALTDPRSTPIGVTAAYSWTEAVQAGLIEHCRRLTIDEALRSRRPFPLADLSMSDEATGKHLSLLDATSGSVAIYDITGTGEVPTVACCLDGRTVAYGCGASPAAALADGVRRLLLAFQSRADREPVYAPVAVPDLPPPLRGRRETSVTAASRDVSQLVSALRARGRRASAVPLDHDRRVHEVMPYLIHVVVTHDHD
jgi:hypothetical protein